MNNLFSQEQKRLIAAVRKHANDHYESNGWDYVVESYEDEEILEAMEGARTPEEAIARVGKIVKIMDSVRKDIQNA